MRRITWAAILLGAVTASTAAPASQVAVGHAGSYLVKNDGTVWVWGDYNGGERAGTPDAEKENTHTKPAPLSGLSDIVAVSAGSGHSTALKRDGTVWTWGYNGEGQLGTRP